MKQMEQILAKIVSVMSCTFSIKAISLHREYICFKKNITCSACNQPGHNKKNKSCPLHPSHPGLNFDDSDDDLNNDFDNSDNN